MSQARITKAFEDSAANFAKLTALAPAVEDAAQRIIKAIEAGNKVIFCGNGGSAADAQHLAAELLGRYILNRKALPAMALTVDTSALTAIGNDYSFDEVYERQLEGIGKAGDVLVGISTSGNSTNVVKALKLAKTLDIETIGLTNEIGGEMAALCDLCLQVPSTDTPRVQEMHIAVGHCLCELIEEAFAD